MLSFLEKNPSLINLSFESDIQKWDKLNNLFQNWSNEQCNWTSGLINYLFN